MGAYVTLADKWVHPCTEPQGSSLPRADVRTAADASRSGIHLARGTTVRISTPSQEKMMPLKPAAGRG